MFSYKYISNDIYHMFLLSFSFFLCFLGRERGGNCIWWNAITYSKEHYYEKAAIQVFQLPNSASSALRRLKSNRATIFNLYIVQDSASNDTTVRYHNSNYLESAYPDNIFTFPMEITFISFQDPRQQQRLVYRWYIGETLWSYK